MTTLLGSVQKKAPSSCIDVRVQRHKPQFCPELGWETPWCALGVTKGQIKRGLPDSLRTLILLFLKNVDACLVTFLLLFTRMTIVASSPLYLHSLVPSEHILLLNGGEILPLASQIKPLCESPSSLRITPNSFPRFTRPDLAHLNHTNLIKDFSFYCLTLATPLSISSTHLLLKAETSFLRLLLFKALPMSPSFLDDSTWSR